MIGPNGTCNEEEESMRYEESWPGGGSNSVVTISGPGISLFLDTANEIDVSAILEALDAAFEAGSKVGYAECNAEDDENRAHMRSRGYPSS
jgi:hypothetical protein